MRKKKIIGVLLVAGALIATTVYFGFHFINELNNFKNSGSEVSNQIDNSSNPNIVKKIMDMENSFNGETKINPSELKGFYEKAHSINKQVIGWIHITNTDINYPVLHGYVDDYYLKHNWKGEPWWNGSIFLDYLNTGIQNVSLINGHNMLNSIMFSQLTKFEDPNFFKGNQLIYLYDGYDNKLLTYKPVTAKIVTPDVFLDLGNHTESNRENFVDNFEVKSLYPNQQYNGNNILLLNTCLSNGTDQHIVVLSEEVN